MMAEILTEDQLRILRHMLGLTHPERGEQVPYRDYYCANPGDVKLLELERLGVVRRYAERDGYWWYCTTEAGKRYAMKSALGRRLPKAKRIYIKFLHLLDCCPDLTFREFLTSPEFSHERRSV